MSSLNFLQKQILFIQLKLDIKTFFLTDIKHDFFIEKSFAQKKEAEMKYVQTLGFILKSSRILNTNVFKNMPLIQPNHSCLISLLTVKMLTVDKH